MVKRVTSLFNSFGSNIAKQVARFFGTFRKMSKIFVRIMSNFILFDQKDNSSGNENVSIVLFFFSFFLFFFLEEEGGGGGRNYLLFFCLLV